MEPLLFARSLQYYKRREVQEAILRHADHREVSPRYGEGFGKRPDVLTYPADILEFAKKKTTSFHVSEERWENPLDIKTGASRKEADALRIGWDLVLDIDAKNWDISRLTAWLFIESLKVHGIKSISVKFSGNKGWHIGVPFESFPATVFDERLGKELETKNLFPELPRAIAMYLLEFMGKPENGMISFTHDKIVFGTRSYSFAEFAALAEKNINDLFENFCSTCNKNVGMAEESYALTCVNPACQYKSLTRYTKEQKDELDDKERVCSKCKKIMEVMLVSKKSCMHDPKSYQRRFKLHEVIQVDTVLLAGRHLYRMAYSLHEKSGLASVVIDPQDVLTFDKKLADPSKISFDKTFLAHPIAGEASDLVLKAWSWQQARNEHQEQRMQVREFEEVTESITEEHFPPCVQKILQGMADGKKRAMFALTNFFLVAGWTPDMIEKRLHEWNEKNPEPLREVIIKGHMHQVRMKKDRILPPNCKSFYQELGVCKPNEFCSRIKNPATYVIKHSRLGAKPKKRKVEVVAKVSDETAKK